MKESQHVQYEVSESARGRRFLSRPVRAGCFDCRRGAHQRNSGDHPTSYGGGTDPERVFDGKDAVLGYLQLILDNFKHAVLVDRQTFSTDDGATVFMEGQGDLILKQTGQPYRNIYVFRFSISDGKITEIREYANPVIYAKALGLKAG
jgi:ketosteroid isomerase-like protein